MVDSNNWNFESRWECSSLSKTFALNYWNIDIAEVFVVVAAAAVVEIVGAYFVDIVAAAEVDADIVNLYKI